MASKKVQKKLTKSRVNIGVLSPQQQMFVQNLLASKSFNGAEAAREAGYKDATAVASRLLNNPTIQRAISQELTNRMRRCQITAADVLEHLTTALFLDPLEFMEVEPDGTMFVKSLRDVPEKYRRCITKIKTQTRYTKSGDTIVTYELEFMSKDRALELSMTHLGLLTKDIKITGEVSVDFLHALRSHVEGHAVVVGRELIEAD